jgi:hypothetical protein
MLKLIKLTVITVLVAGLNACCSPKPTLKHQEKTASSTTKIKQKAMSYEIILQESHGGFKTQKTILINDNAGLSKAMMQLNMIRKPGLPAPKVDFEKSTVLALFFGTRNNGGSQYEVVKLEEVDGSIVLEVVEKNPEIATTVITQPTMFIKIPKTASKEISLKLLMDNN